VKLMAGLLLLKQMYEKNLYGAHTLPEVLDQAEAITDIRARRTIVDRGYRGRAFVDGTEILVPGRAPRGQSRATSAAMRKRFRRRAAIEPVIIHLKADFRLLRCFLKGFQGDQLNLMLAAAA
jgi:transposase, IS5 family